VNSYGQTGKPKVDATKAGRPKLAIEYFAEYNLYEDEFGDSHKYENTSLYTFDEACQVCPEGWHLPTQEEWAGLFPYAQELDMVNEKISVNGVTKSYFSKYADKNGIRYAIRFMRDQAMAIDNKLLQAYRYETVGSTENGDLRLKITVRYLGRSFKGSIDDIANEGWWNTNREQDAVREFPYLPTTFDASQKSNTDKGNYWTSSTPSNAEIIAPYKPRFVVAYPGGHIWYTNSKVIGTQVNTSILRYMSVRCIENIKKKE
jgi:uncharacterized protein (TIGR02145 family)